MTIAVSQGSSMLGELSTCTSFSRHRVFHQTTGLPVANNISDVRTHPLASVQSVAAMEAQYPNYAQVLCCHCYMLATVKLPCEHLVCDACQSGLQPGECPKGRQPPSDLSRLIKALVLDE